MARTRDKAALYRNSAQAECMHYWVIDSPEGPTSTGICKLCGAKHEFQNYIQYPSWQDGKWKISDKQMAEAGIPNNGVGFRKARWSGSK